VDLLRTSALRSSTIYQSLLSHELSLASCLSFVPQLRILGKVCLSARATGKTEDAMLNIDAEHRFLVTGKIGYVCRDPTAGINDATPDLIIIVPCRESKPQLLCIFPTPPRLSILNYNFTTPSIPPFSPPQSCVGDKKQFVPFIRQ
jgi:hypothetical protein